MSDTPAAVIPRLNPVTKARPWMLDKETARKSAVVLADGRLLKPKQAVVVANTKRVTASVLARWLTGVDAVRYEVVRSSNSPFGWTALTAQVVLSAEGEPVLSASCTEWQPSSYEEVMVHNARCCNASQSKVAVTAPLQTQVPFIVNYFNATWYFVPTERSLETMEGCCHELMVEGQTVKAIPLAPFASNASVSARTFQLALRALKEEGQLLLGVPGIKVIDADTGVEAIKGPKADYKLEVGL